VTAGPISPDSWILQRELEVFHISGANVISAWRGRTAASSTGQYRQTITSSNIIGERLPESGSSRPATHADPVGRQTSIPATPPSAPVLAVTNTVRVAPACRSQRRHVPGDGVTDLKFKTVQE